MHVWIIWLHTRGHGARDCISETYYYGIHYCFHVEGKSKRLCGSDRYIGLLDPNLSLVEVVAIYLVIFAHQGVSTFSTFPDTTKTQIQCWSY